MSLNSALSWEQRKLCDVVKEITRNDPESEAPIMMITANNGFIEQSERYEISELSNGYPVYARYSVEAYTRGIKAVSYTHLRAHET